MYKSAIERFIKFHSNTLNKTKRRDMPCSWKKIERIYICACVCVYTYSHKFYICVYIYIYFCIYIGKNKYGTLSAAKIHCF